MNKTGIASVLTEIGTLLELKGENPFKIRAYQAGARVVESLGEGELAERIAAGTLEEVKGIGEALAQKITELHTTGKLGFFEKLRDSIPAGLIEILSIPGIGPKKIRALHEKLGIDSIAKLQQACLGGKIAALDGFGEKSQEKILEGIRNREKYGRRHLWAEAFAVAEPILAGLRALPQVRRAEHAGSLRRKMETVGDLDFLVATTEPAPIVAWFVAQADVKEVTAQGETKASVRLVSGIQADLRLVPPEQFVFALHHFTGSKDHNVALRQRALAQGLSMSEWGLFPADEKHGPSAGTKPEGGNLRPEKETGGPASLRAGSGDGTRSPVKHGPQGRGPSSESTPQVSGFRSQVSIKTESDLFKALGLAFIPPELREGLGEIEAAEISAGGPETRGTKPDGENGGPASLRADDGLEANLSKGRNGPQGRGPSTESAPHDCFAISAPSAPSGFGSPPGRGLPRLLEEEDIRGVFHNHTTASDGHNTLEEMTAAAQALGLEYLGLADHSKSSVQARGLTEERLAAQVAEITKLNASGKYKCRVFTGTECDILPDGTLDFGEDVRSTLDYVVVSVHSSFRQDRETMTKRIIRAIESPHVTMLGHLTGRLLLEREGYEVDVEKVIDAAIANRVIIELNASPWRLDMDWRLWRKAAQRGLLCSINPDAHDTGQLELFRVGVGAARKGWLTKEHVLNTKPLAQVKQWLAARR